MFDQFSSEPQENLLSSVGLAALNSSLNPENAVIVPASGLSPEQNINQLVTVNPADSLLLSEIGGLDTARAVTLVNNNSSDALTGEAMNIAKGKLLELAQAPDFIEKMNIPFGENWNREVANTLKQNWLKGDFSFMPTIEIVAKGEIAGANGAFAQATDTIYLSQKFLRENGTNSQAVADVLLEEIGHSIDSKINIADSPGDEGAIFSAVVQRKELSQNTLFNLKNENDHFTYRLLDSSTLDLELNRITGYYPKKTETESNYTLNVIDPEETQMSDFLKQNSWKTGFDLEISQRYPIPGQIIDFELTIDINNTKFLTSGFSPYTVLGFPNNKDGSYRDKITDVGSYVSWLAVRNGDFVNPDKWTLEIDDGSASPWIFEGININGAVSEKRLAFQGGMNFSYKPKELEKSFEVENFGNYGAYKDKPYEWVGIYQKVNPFNDNGKLFAGKELKLKGQIQVETANVKGDSLNMYFITQPLYSSTSFVGSLFGDTSISTPGGVQLQAAGKIVSPLVTEGTGGADFS
jgi:hypothetical protein